MSWFSSQGLSLALYKPWIVTAPIVTLVPITNYYPDHTCVASIGDRINAYTHSITAMGGYEAAQFTLVCSLPALENWIQTGLNLHVVVRNPAGVEIWEGFVNQIAIGAGSYSVTLGPVLDIGNRIVVVYNRVDTSARPPLSGEPGMTAAADLPESIYRYVVVWKIRTANDMTDAGAIALRDYWLNSEDAWPRPTMKLDLQGPANVEMPVTFNCLGYAARLDYPYNQTALSGDIDLSALLALILDDDPNRLFASTNASIATNTTQRKRYWNKYLSAWTIIKELVALGDAGAFRYLFMVGNGRKVTYARIPGYLTYVHRLSDAGQNVSRLRGGIVKPWDVTAGVWMQMIDYMVGQSIDTFTSLRQDPRNIFIERVTYTMPWGLQIEGGITDRISQKLARMGLGGRG